MKRIAAITVCIVMLISLLSVTAFAVTASATLTGPESVRAGDTITLTFNLNGKGLFGASGALNYDSNQVELTGTKQKVGGSWMVEFNGKNFVAYDNDLAKPISSTTALFTATFKIKSNLAVGTKIQISCTGVTATDGNEDGNIGTVTYSATIAPPASKDNDLKKLEVSNATISPAFSASTTSYTAEVPFSVSKLDVKAEANDSNAKVSINSPNLTPGGTTKVTVTVTAENGSTKTYTISVKREQDPNYVASNNNNVSDITVDGFLLSPVFSADNTHYVIWLPYETESVNVSGVAADGLASVRVEGGERLTAGADNEIKVICTAEDGTEKVYTIIAKRAPAHNGSTEPTEPAEPTDPPAEPTVPIETEPTEPGDEPTKVPTDPTVAPTEPKAPVNGEEADGVPVIVLIPVSIVCSAVGLIVGVVIGKKKK